MMKMGFFTFTPGLGAAAAAPARAAARFRDGVDLVEEDNARRRRPRLVEQLTDVGLGLPEPHGEQLRPLDGYEVGVALVRNGLGQQRLAAPGRAIEEHALARGLPELPELLRMLHRVLDRLDQLLLDLLEAAHVVPRRLRDLHPALAQRRRVAYGHSLGEVAVLYHELVEHRGRDLVLELQHVHGGQVLADAAHGRLEAELRQVSPDVAVALLCDFPERYVGAEPHAARLDLQNLVPLLLVAGGDLDLAVEAAEAAQRRVNGVDAIGSGEHDHVFARRDAVHERQQLADDAPLELAGALLALGGDGVDLVDEDDRGRVLRGLLERPPQFGLGLAHVVRHDLWPVYDHAVRPSLRRDRPGDERLAGPRRPVQYDPLRRRDPHRLVHLRVQQRQLDELPDLGELFVHAADLVVPQLAVRAVVLLARERRPRAVQHALTRDQPRLRVGDAAVVAVERLDCHHLELHCEAAGFLVVVGKQRQRRFAAVLELHVERQVVPQADWAPPAHRHFAAEEVERDLHQHLGQRRLRGGWHLGEDRRHRVLERQQLHQLGLRHVDQHVH
ncbi:uncharacterized protein BcabD6B2_42650 [Babesia caballi]|uniref:Uncharacterized protein n=1 Tax=Babesia caballi TaxID=5871 RepID=A0AAV4LYX5_BABCB|nr:hypothetical protein BcabD6B2_42650 [Babesia caballi]